MEGTRTSLYRTALLVLVPAFALCGFGMKLPILVVLAGGLAVQLALGWLLARRGLSGLRLERTIYPSGFEGDEVHVDITVSNFSRGSKELLEIGDRFGPGLADLQLFLEPGPLPDGYERKHTYVGFCSRHWGVYPVGPVQATATDPMGLFTATEEVPDVEIFSVFPRVYDVAGLDRLGARASLAPQSASAGRAGQSLQYLGVRDWRPGDPMRRIHWPATARRGIPVVKEFEVDLVPYFSLFLDFRKKNRAGTGRKSTLEYLVRTGASLLWSAVHRGYTVQLAGEDLLVPPGTGDLHLAVALDRLIHKTMDGEQGLLDVVEPYRPHLPEGSVAALLFSTIDVELAPISEMIEGFRARGIRPLVVFINNFTFAAWEKWPLQREQILERCREIEYYLRSRGIPGAILGADHELEEEFARPELFGGAP